MHVRSKPAGEVSPQAWTEATESAGATANEFNHRHRNSRRCRMMLLAHACQLTGLVSFWPTSRFTQCAGWGMPYSEPCNEISTVMPSLINSPSKRNIAASG
jgi:hypothetical protein